jgi:hypothetical protein
MLTMLLTGLDVDTDVSSLDVAPVRLFDVLSRFARLIPHPGDSDEIVPFSLVRAEVLTANRLEHLFMGAVTSLHLGVADGSPRAAVVDMYDETSLRLGRTRT